MPSLKGEEWYVPWWIGSQERLLESVAILKLVATPGWIVYVLRNRPRIPVFHIIRHPGGFLNSWMNRYVATRDEESIRRRNHERLRDVAGADPEWAERFGEIDSMSTEEAELWYWCYANEVIHRAGCESGSYVRVVYEELAEDPVPIVKKLYARCNLEWTPPVEAAVLDNVSVSASISGAWRTKLDPRQIGLVERFLAEARSFYS
jgi:hypothetical protein